MAALDLRYGLSYRTECSETVSGFSKINFDLSATFFQVQITLHVFSIQSGFEFSVCFITNLNMFIVMSWNKQVWQY